MGWPSSPPIFHKRRKERPHSGTEERREKSTCFSKYNRPEMSVATLKRGKTRGTMDSTTKGRKKQTSQIDHHLVSPRRKGKRIKPATAGRGEKETSSLASHRRHLLDAKKKRGNVWRPQKGRKGTLAVRRFTGLNKKRKKKKTQLSIQQRERRGLHTRGRSQLCWEKEERRTFRKVVQRRQTYARWRIIAPCNLPVTKKREGRGGKKSHSYRNMAKKEKKRVGIFLAGLVMIG